MNKALIVLLLWCSLAHAITWKFDREGDAQGWYARESPASGGGDQQPLPVEVVDGVMRVGILALAEGKRPTVLLVSPLLEYDSALFDRVEARIRLIVQTPVVGHLVMSWTNARNRARPGWALEEDGSPSESFLFLPSPPMYTYTTQWQTISLHGFAAMEEKAWADTLLDIRLQFGLGYGDVEMPQALEVDWIRLTGVDELLQGELPPPAAFSRPVPGELFAPAEFQSLSLPGLVRPALGDLDNDGRLDLIVSSDYTTPALKQDRYLATAYNDGSGHFRRGSWSLDSREIVKGGGYLVWYEVGDLQGTGCMDIVLQVGTTNSILMNDHQGGFSRQSLATGGLRGIYDLDQDNDLDVVLGVDEITGLVNDGQGRFDQQVKLALDIPGTSTGDWESLYLGSLTGKGPLQLLWRHNVKFPFYDPTTYQTTSLSLPAGLGDPQYLDASFVSSWLVCIGDFNNDGQVDLGIAKTLQNEGTGYRAAGLVAWMNQGNNHLVAQDWLPNAMLYPSYSLSPNLPQTSAWLPSWDLDGDGISDQVFVDVNPRIGQNATVLLGQGGEMPVLEGQYALPGGILGVADAGDIDGDGDLDLVVATSYAGGGIWVLRNLSEGFSSAVTEDQASSQPTTFRLGNSYPNPFNPATVIPLSLPSSGTVRIEILNLAGQQIRVLQDGGLTPGEHELTWDGRNEAGRSVASGAYLCRARMGNQVQVRKLTRLE